MLTPKNHPNLLNADNAILVVIDVQEALLRTIHNSQTVLKSICTLMQGANELRIPIISTIQNREKLGDVLPEVRRWLPPLLPPFDKMSFSCYDAPSFASEVQRSGRKQVLLCGVETHICVSQTAHALIAAGFQVHVITDAVSSRTEANWRVGLDKMRQAGVLFSSVEMALFELLGEAGTPEFREILKIVK